MGSTTPRIKHAFEPASVTAGRSGTVSGVDRRGPASRLDRSQACGGVEDLRWNGGDQADPGKPRVRSRKNRFRCKNHEILEILSTVLGTVDQIFLCFWLGLGFQRIPW